MTLLGLNRDVNNLKDKVERLRPSFSAGVLTSHTTRGTLRSANSLSQTTNNSNTSVKARWA